MRKPLGAGHASLIRPRSPAGARAIAPAGRKDQYEPR